MVAGDTGGSGLMLDPAWLAQGPLVIGATGGSGTRVVARIVREAGVFIGDRLNPSEDPWALIDLYDRHLNAWLADPAGSDDDFSRELLDVVREHERPGPWGWKEPRSIYALPLLARLFAGLRFVHVVRDGRDMALSSNQNQLRKHGATVLGDDGAVTPARSLALWASVNARAHAFGRDILGERYLVMRFEDLCARPVDEAARLLAFAGVEHDPAQAARLVAPPGSLGRWRAADAAALGDAGGQVLATFGYV